MAVINSFLSYLLVFIVLVAIAVIGAMIGIKLAKAKAAKATDKSAGTEADKKTEA